MTLTTGTLIVRKKKSKILFQIKGEKADRNIGDGEVSQTIIDNPDMFADKEVEFEIVGGQPKKVRESGGEFIPPAPAVSGLSKGRKISRTQGKNPRNDQGGNPQQQNQAPRLPGGFHNPYNFIPALPRNTGDLDLGDHPPARKDRFEAGRYSGRFRVRMTAKTPLLVPDKGKEAGGHKIFSILREKPGGKPLIPASSVRGMLRSAYEAATHSRFGCLKKEQHKDRLAFRMMPQEGLNLIPARVDGGQLHLLNGTSRITPGGKPGGPLYAAWLRRYWKGKLDHHANRYPDGGLPCHGDFVKCWVEKIRHNRPNFFFWRVREIVPATHTLGGQPPPSKNEKKSSPATPPEWKQIEGYVCITNANINRKHDERVFFSSSSVGIPGPFLITDAHKAMWQELIQNYQSIHEDDLKKRRADDHLYTAYLGSDPGDTAWSRHVYSAGDLELRDGSLCYVRLNEDLSEIEGIFPVMISRALYPASPWSLLDDSLKPADSIEKLSPADRVFGWVGGTDNKSDSARGLLQVGPVKCETSAADAVAEFEPGVPLAILAGPKPQQGRFYVAKTKKGEAQGDGLNKRQAGYTPKKGLRGRKIYPHHQGLPEKHWENPMEDRTIKGAGSPKHFQEYRRPKKNGKEQQDDQNRTITAWVKPGASFVFDLHFTNLSTVEIGALVWLLNLPENHFLRFGGGKPFGFGSVRLKMDEHEIQSPEARLKRYGAWHTEPVSSDLEPETAKEAFKNALRHAYPGDSDSEPVFIRSFLRACKGFDDRLPVHYPRVTEDGQAGPPSPEGKSFEWFVKNEKRGNLYALPDIISDTGLPFFSK